MKRQFIGFAFVCLAGAGLATSARSEPPRRFTPPSARARRVTSLPKVVEKTPIAKPAPEPITPESVTPESVTPDSIAPEGEVPPTIQETPVIDATATPEIIRERYPNRGVRIERQVVQDVQLNYVNHGPWSWWDERGQPLAKGEYRLGKQHGKWTRIHTVEKGTIFALPIYRGFERPFTSEATFHEGVLQGAWTVTDAKGRKVSHWNFDSGEQHGLATWWHTNGQTQRTANYKHGVIDGELREYNSRGELLAKESYVDGCKMDSEVANYSPGKKQSQRSVLIAVPREHYNFFQGTVSLERVERPKIYHGPSTWWYADGQRAMTGNYEQGTPSGEFIWWHANGQEHSRGNYKNGEQEGRWTWWHTNGQKEMEGEYHIGHRVGKWAAWNADGKVRLVEDHPAAQEVPVIASGPHNKQAANETLQAPSIEP